MTKPTQFKLLIAMMTFVATLHVQAQVIINIDAQLRGPLTSPWQYGLFFEEINHAGDGGLYAELIRNRSFEDNIDPTVQTVPEYWTTVNGATAQIVTNDLLNDFQQHAMLLTTTDASPSQMQGVVNRGFWSMRFDADSTYTLSLWVKALNEGYTGTLFAQLQSTDAQTIYGETTIEGEIPVGQWTHLTATIRATSSVTRGRFALLTSNNGQLLMDVVSLFPYTWKGRKNGLRRDLAQLLADLHPTFLR